MYAADTNNIFLLLKLIRTAPLRLLFHLHAGALLLRIIANLSTESRVLLNQPLGRTEGFLDVRGM